MGLMPFLLRATPQQDLAGQPLRSKVNLTVTGHSRDTPDQTRDATKHRNVLAPHPPSGHYALVAPLALEIEPLAWPADADIVVSFLTAHEWPFHGVPRLSAEAAA